MSDDLVKRLRFGSLSHLGSSRMNLEAADRIEALEAALLAADELYRATSFLADNDPDDVVCDGGGTAILVGLSGIRHALATYRARRDTGGGT